MWSESTATGVLFLAGLGKRPGRGGQGCSELESGLAWSRGASRGKLPCYLLRCK